MSAHQPLRGEHIDIDRLRAALARATDTLTRAGVPSPRVDAMALAAHLLRESPLVLASAPPIPVSFDEEFDALVRRRSERQPLQHLVGTTMFRHLSVTVRPGVFTPRPETEVVAQRAIDEARRLVATGARPVVVDLCCGSGVIALAVALEVPESTVVAVDLAAEAVALTRENAERTGAAALRVEQGDVAAADTLADLDGAVDVVVTNPPYIPEGAHIRDPEVAEHDPALALWSGADGLDLMRGIERRASVLLRPGGLLVAEHADAQQDEAPAVFTATGRWHDVADHPDLAGRPRLVTARRASPGVPTVAVDGEKVHP